MVPRLGPEGCVADVGTDHGFVPIRLVELGVCGRALAMDVRPGPLARARDHIRRHGLERQIDTRLGDGLEKLMPGEAQVVVIAGMGGELMLRILEEGSHVRRKISHWILSPQSELSQFRHGLEGLGLCIREEEMLQEDGKYYTIMDVVPGAMDYKREYQYRYGDRLIQKRSPVLAEYLEREMSQNRRIRAGLEGQTGEGAARRLGELVQEYQVMEEAWAAMEGKQKDSDASGGSSGKTGDASGRGSGETGDASGRGSGKTGDARAGNSGKTGDPVPGRKQEAGKGV